MDDTLQLEMDLLSNQIVQFGEIQVKPLTLGEIRKIGIHKYMNLIHFTTLDKMRVVGRENMPTFEPYSFYEIVVAFDALRNNFLEFLEIFTIHDVDGIQFVPTLDLFVVNNNGVKGKIHSDNFAKFLEFMRFVYCVSNEKKDSEDENIDEEMAEMLQAFEDTLNKINRADENKITMVSIIEAISSKHPTMNMSNIWDYNMYQIMKTYRRLDHIDNSSNVMTGLYSGSVDGEKIVIGDFYWAKELKG